MDTVPTNLPGLMSTADRTLSGMSALSEKTELDSLNKLDHSARAAEPAAAPNSERQAAGALERLSLETGAETEGAPCIYLPLSCCGGFVHA